MSPPAIVTAMSKRLLGILCSVLIPAARCYLRYTPWSWGKRFVFRAVRWHPSQQTAKTLAGIRMHLQTDELVEGYLYYFGTWEPNLTALVSDRLSKDPSRTFIDVGANIGHFSLLAAQILKKGTVVALEPSSRNFRRLVENAGLNGFANIRAINMAATAMPAEVLLYPGGPNNIGGGASLSQGDRQTDPEIVKGAPLSSLLDPAEIRTARLVKIDVEGAEAQVVQDLAAIIDQMPDDVEFAVEITPGFIPDGDGSEIHAFFKAAGFFPYDLQNCYDPSAYIHRKPSVVFPRIGTALTERRDVLFSRIDAASIQLSVGGGGEA